MKEAAGGSLVEFDLALHAEVEISRPAAVVWPYLERLREWKDSVVSLEHLEGTPGTVGAVQRIGQRPGTVTVHVLHRTLAVTAPRWKIQSMVAEDGVTTDGYVIYTLVERDGRSLVLCDVVAKVRVPQPSAHQAGGIEQLAHTANEATLAKLDADHRKLKQWIERS